MQLKPRLVHKPVQDLIADAIDPVRGIMTCKGWHVGQSRRLQRIGLAPGQPGNETESIGGLPDPFAFMRPSAERAVTAGRAN